MKFSKTRRNNIQEDALDSYHCTGSWKYGSGDTSKMVLDFIDDIEELESRLAGLEKQLDWYKSGDIHTCHAECKRPHCITHRRLAWAEGMLKEAKGFATEIEDDFRHSEFCKYDDGWEDEVEENRNVDECWKCAMAVWLSDLARGLTEKGAGQ